MRCLNCHHDDLPADSVLCPNCGTHLPTLLRDLLPPGHLLQGGKYQLQSALGAGGFGVTYLAHRQATAQQVAIKEYFPRQYSQRQAAAQGRFSLQPLNKNQDHAFERGLRHFVREGKLLGQLNHPGIVRVEDFFEENGTAYLVMEYLQGQTLKVWLAQQGGKLPADEVERLGEQLVSALACAHAEGIYHLDIKPENIVLQDQQLKLIDFGSARPAGGQSQSTRSFTSQYAAPEVMAQHAVGPYSDIFELAMVLHELLTGASPPEALQRVFNPWTPEGLPEPWQALLNQALQLEPEQRPQDLAAWWQSRLHTTTPALPLRVAPLKIHHLPDFSNALDMHFMYIPPLQNSAHALYPLLSETAYYIQQTPVTRQQWQQLMPEDPSVFCHAAELPVHNISWQDAQTFVARLNATLSDGGRYRLPHEWEWEYAAGEVTDVLSRNALPDYAWFGLKEASAQGPAGPQPVAQKQPNARGLYDCLGNVWEWCLERYSPQIGETGLEPRDATWVVNRVQRGGCWYSPARRCQFGTRDFARADLRNHGFGLRLVRVVEQSESAAGAVNG